MAEVEDEELRGTVASRMAEMKARTKEKVDMVVKVVMTGLLILGMCIIALTFCSLLMNLTDLRFNVAKFGTVFVKLHYNATETGLAVETTPNVFKMKIIAMYLVDDMIGSATSDGQFTAKLHFGNFSPPVMDFLKGGYKIRPQQRKRRVYFNTACDPDGDGEINDCDTSSPWLFPKQVTNWVDLAATTDKISEQLNAQRSQIKSDRYKYIVIQSCLLNVANASYFAFQGGTMLSPYLFRGVKHPKCFHLTRPLVGPDGSLGMDVRHNEMKTITIGYSLGDTLAVYDPALNKYEDEWVCNHPTNTYCVRMPEFEATWKDEICEPFGCKTKDVQEGNSTNTTNALDGLDDSSSSMVSYRANIWFATVLTAIFASARW